MRLSDLQENKTYTLTFDVNEPSYRQKINCVKVQIKLEKTIKLLDIDMNETKWYQTSQQANIFDEVPVKYFRKEKLEKIEDVAI